MLGFFFVPQVTFAADIVKCGKDPNRKALGGIPSIWRNIDPCNLTLSDVPVLLANAASILLLFGAIISLIMIIVGGIQYLISAGNPDMLRLAQNTLMYAVGGFILCVASYAIIRYILGSIFG